MNNEIEIGNIVLDNEIEIGEIVLDVRKVYPELENLEITPSGKEQKFNHPNSYGYDEITVKAVSSDILEVTPSKENQKFEGLYNTVNISKIPDEYKKLEQDQWYTKEVEEWT